MNFAPKAQLFPCVVQGNL